VTLTNCIFSSISSTGTDALAYHSSSSSAEKCALICTNCSFTTFSMTSTSTVSAGVFYLTSGSTGRAYTITDCTFQNLNVLGSTLMISAYFTSFTFTNNKFITCNTTKGNVAVLFLIFFFSYFILLIF
jgi:hypothetical protein